MHVSVRQGEVLVERVCSGAADNDSTDGRAMQRHEA